MIVNLAPALNWGNMPTCQPVVQTVKTAVMETLSCCVPGEIGTDFPAAAALLMAN
jgi:hypothetical protein